MMVDDDFNLEDDFINAMEREQRILDAMEADVFATRHNAWRWIGGGMMMCGLIILLGMLVGSLSGCAMSVGGGLNESITVYDDDGEIESVTVTIVNAPKNYATVFAKQDKGVSNFRYTADGNKFSIASGSEAAGQTGSSPEEFTAAIMSIVGPAGISGIVSAITDKPEPALPKE